MDQHNARPTFDRYVVSEDLAMGLIGPFTATHPHLARQMAEAHVQKCEQWLRDRGMTGAERAVLTPNMAAAIQASGVTLISPARDWELLTEEPDEDERLETITVTLELVLEMSALQASQHMAQELEELRQDEALMDYVREELKSVVQYPDALQIAFKGLVK